MVCHTIRGRTPSKEGRAQELAKLGYVAFATDAYGASHIGGNDVVSRSTVLDRDDKFS